MVYPCLRLIFSLAERSLGPRRFWHSGHLAHQGTSTGMSFPSFCDETDFLPELLQSTAVINIPHSSPSTKKSRFDPPVHMRPHGPDPLLPLWTSTHGRHEIHTTLLEWLVQ